MGGIGQDLRQEAEGRPAQYGPVPGEARSSRPRSRRARATILSERQYHGLVAQAGEGEGWKPQETKPASTEGRPWGQPLKKAEGAPLNLALGLHSPHGQCRVHFFNSVREWCWHWSSTVRDGVGDGRLVVQRRPQGGYNAGNRRRFRGVKGPFRPAQKGNFKWPPAVRWFVEGLGNCP